MSQNSRTQCLNIIKANPGLCGEEIGKRCVPAIQVNTVIKNISHIRDELGDSCIKRVFVSGKNAGVEYATYFWQDTKKLELQEQIADWRKIQGTYPEGHRQRDAIETQIKDAQSIII